MIYKVNYDNRKIYEWKLNDSDIKKVEYNDSTVFQKSIINTNVLKDFLYRWTDYQGNITTVYDTVGDGVVQAYAEQNNADIYNLEFGDRAKYVGNNAFQGCTNLSGLTVPSNILAFSFYAFDGCTNIKNFSLGFGWNGYGWDYNPYTMKPYRKDGVSAQTGVNFKELAVKELSIPYTMEMICNDFQWFSKCETLTINNGVKYIYDSFNIFPKLKWLDIPPSVIILGGFSSFGGKSVHIPSGNLKQINLNSFFNSPNMTMFGCESPRFETLGTNSISSCPQLKEVYFANMLTMEDGCLSSNNSLEKFKFPNSIKWVGDSCFNNCINIKTIDFGEDIEHIGSKLGYRDIDKKQIWSNVVIRNETPPEWNGRPTDLSDKTIYVPDNAVTVYQENWTDVATIIKPMSQYTEE